MALCPFHEDSEASLMVGPGYGFYCFGCGEGGALPKLEARIIGVAADYWAREVRKRQRSVRYNDPFGEAVAWYNYKYPNGKLAYQVVRYDPKDFRCRRPHPTRPNKWIYSIQGVTRILYRLPELHMRPDEVVLFVEGEKDADTLHKRGYLGTTTVGGANGSGRTSLSGLAGRTVCLLPDNDGAGASYCALLSRRLAGCAVSYTLARPAAYETGGVQDITDALESDEAGTVAFLDGLAEGVSQHA